MIALTGGVIVGLSALISAGCLGVVHQRFRAVSSIPSLRADELVQRLRRTERARRLDVVCESEGVESWERRLAVALRASPDPRERADILSEFVSEAGKAFDSTSAWARDATRTALASGAVFASLAVAQASWFEGGVSLLVALAAGAGCHAIGTAAAGLETRQRKVVDELVRLLDDASG
jgi:hypothetical protein